MSNSRPMKAILEDTCAHCLHFRQFVTINSMPELKTFLVNTLRKITNIYHIADMFEVNWKIGFQEAFVEFR